MIRPISFPASFARPSDRQKGMGRWHPHGETPRRGCYLGGVFVSLTVGIGPIGEALRLAQDSELDRVEVAPMARPPVVKLMDYGKFKYESAQKAREARRNQALTVIKEMRLRLKIDPHDYETKKGHVERFLRGGDKVKITVMFRGREQSRPEMGYRLLQRLASDVAELGVVESNPKQDGRNMVMVIAPHRNQAATDAARRSAKAEKAAEGQTPQA